MAKLFYSMSGEGRGHATRVRAIVDALAPNHDISIFAPGNAYDFLAPIYKDSKVPVEEIPGLRFFYDKDGHLDRRRTAQGNISWLMNYRKLREELELRIRVESPNTVITDFEPALPRAARRQGLPFISLNHQHFLIVNDLSSLPGYLQRHAWMMKQVVARYYSGMELTIVSSFYFPPLKKQYEGKVVQVGSILRPAVVSATRSHGGHLLAYIRKFAPDNLMRAFRECGMPVKLYGLGEKPDDGNISFRPVDEKNFLADLASCEALVTTAGNQLVGEALFLHKPVLALPEKGNYEQYINAHFLAGEGGGEWVLLEDLDGPVLQGFLSRLDSLRSRIEPERYHGNPKAVAAVEEFLSQFS